MNTSVGPFSAALRKSIRLRSCGAISEVEMIGMPLAHVGGTPLPAGDDVGASGHGNAVVEAEVALLLAHTAPVGRVERRTHAQISNRGSSAFPLCRKMFYRTTRYREAERREKYKWHPIRGWCRRRHAPSSTNSIQAKSPRSICSTCWSSGSVRGVARCTL